MPDQSSSTEPSTTGDAPSFEDSLSEIQSIVDDLEEGAIGLEESMQRFERGTALLRRGYELLKGAEQRIEILTGRDADGDVTTEPFDASATHEKDAPQAGRRKKKPAKKTKRASDESDEETDTLF